MPELSFPFDADNANGGSQVVSQTQWQQMSSLWTSDRVDFPIVGNTYTNSGLPFPYTISNRTITFGAGSAWVGGFYYKLSGTLDFTIAANSTSQVRIDLVVLRADMATSSVKMAVVSGTPSATPVTPVPTRQVGGVWEMPLYAVTSPANNGTISLSRRAPHSFPAHVAFPWSAPDSLALMPKNSFAMDMDVDGTGFQQEIFRGRYGTAVTRDLAVSHTYTPEALYVDAIPSVNRRGRWRWIAPNVIWFSLTIVNDYEDEGAMVTGSNSTAGVSLPYASNPKMIQTMHGSMLNPYRNGNYPNMMSITALTRPGSNVLFLYNPNAATVSEGLDSLRGFPARSTFHISGTYEANVFND